MSNLERSDEVVQRKKITPDSECNRCTKKDMDLCFAARCMCHKLICDPGAQKQS